MIMSTTIGLEELLRKKAHLKNNLQSLCEEEKHLAHKFRILEEQKVVHELEDKIKAKQVVIGQLRTKKIELEKRWNSSVLETISGFPPWTEQLHT